MPIRFIKKMNYFIKKERVYTLIKLREKNARDIAIDLGCSTSAISAIIQQMRELGFVQRLSRGRYKLTDKGSNAYALLKDLLIDDNS